MNDHKSWVRSVFDRAAPEYGMKGCSFFNYFGKRLVEQVDVSLNQHALDVATGRGAILFPLAQRVGPLGQVVGIDISTQMIEEITKEAKGKNIDWVDCQCMDAEHLHFPDNSFDVVFCGFALFFFPSIYNALSECKRVLKPGGKLAVSIWGKKSELTTWVNEEVKKFSIKDGLNSTPLGKGCELQKLLVAAHFDSVQITEEVKVFFHTTSDAWWNSLWTHAIRGKLEQLSSEQLDTLREKAMKKAESLRREEGVAEELQVFYGIAQKNNY